TGADATHVFKDNGQYTVTITVTDGDGGSTSQTLDVTVNNIAPSITEVDGKTTLNEGEAVNYSAVATDPGDDELTYTWNFGDGTEQSTVNSQQSTVEHTYTQNGDYRIEVTVSDEDGAATVSNLDVTVNNVAPIIDTESIKTGEEGSAVTFEYMYALLLTVDC
ncbi:MAG: PKD domain-containing protein, partial [Cyanobacteria bacterium J06638_38]